MKNTKWNLSSDSSEVLSYSRSVENNTSTASIKLKNKLLTKEEIETVLVEAEAKLESLNVYYRRYKEFANDFIVDNHKNIQSNVYTCARMTSAP